MIMVTTTTVDSNSLNEIELQTTSHDSNILALVNTEKDGKVTNQSKNDVIKLKKEGNEDPDWNGTNTLPIIKSEYYATLHKGEINHHILSRI